MSRRHGRRARSPENVELDITAFMNLMVILVPFLLITAVFTHLTVLDINLPTHSQSNNSTKNKKAFEINVIIGKKYFVISRFRVYHVLFKLRSKISTLKIGEVTPKY